MTYEATYMLVTGIALGLSVRPLYRRLLTWAEGLAYDVGETQDRIDAARAFAPRSVPMPHTCRLVREPFDWGRGA